MNDGQLHHFMEDLAPIIILPIMFVAMAWIISRIIEAFKHRAQLKTQTEFHNKLLEKFGTGEEFAAYLKSEAGKNFFEQMTVEPISPLSKILNSVRIGVVLTLLGLGVGIFTPQFPGPDVSNIIFLFGVICTAIGIGFLISSAISYRLVKVWGLINTNKTPAPVVAETPAPTA